MNVVLYGDSNTYGLMPNGGRYKNRFSNILKRYFDNKINIYEEGLVGRTTIYDDQRPNRKAVEDINQTLSKYKNIDLLVIMLGTNDYKKGNAKNIDDLKNGMRTLLNKILYKNDIKKLLIISPILLAKNIEELDSDFNHESYILSKNGFLAYKDLANEYNALFLDAKDLAKPGIDGEHFEESGHINIADNLINIINNYDNGGF